MTDFVNVATAYLSMYDDYEQIPVKLLKLMEKTVEKNALHFDAHQAIVLAQFFSMSGTSHTMEVFDRIIGSQIDDLPINEVYSALLAFTST